MIPNISIEENSRAVNELDMESLDADLGDSSELLQLKEKAGVNTLLEKKAEKRRFQLK